jgi:hypothetical protein
MTDAEIAAGVAAAESYEGWESGFIGAQHNHDMAALVGDAADAATDQSAAGRQEAAVASLTKVIADNGYASEVSATMIAGVVTAVLGAVANLRKSS